MDKKILIDRVRLAIAIAHGLQFQAELDGFKARGMKNVAEAAWYQTIVYCLGIVFSDNPLITTNPQRPIKRRVHSESKDMDIVKKLIPDFMIFLSRYRIVEDTTTITQTAVIMVVEVKPTPKPGADIIVVRREAWAQALQQAAYVLEKYKNRQKEVGVMVTVGVHWSFYIVKDTEVPPLPEETDDDYNPFDTSAGEHSQTDSDISARVSETEINGIVLNVAPTFRAKVTRRSKRFTPAHVGRAPVHQPRSTVAPPSVGPSRAPATQDPADIAFPPREADGTDDIEGARGHPRHRRFGTFDPNSVVYYTFGTPVSDEAFVRMRSRLERMQGFEEYKWQKVFKNKGKKRFSDMEKMFNRMDKAHKAPPKK